MPNNYKPGAEQGCLLGYTNMLSALGMLPTTFTQSRPESPYIVCIRELTRASRPKPLLPLGLIASRLRDVRTARLRELGWRPLPPKHASRFKTRSSDSRPLSHQTTSDYSTTPSSEMSEMRRCVSSGSFAPAVCKETWLGFIHFYGEWSTTPE
jgi:hypothetical protein